MGCLDEQTVVAFVGGALTGATLAAVERHLVGCPSCAALVAVAVPTTTRPLGSPPAPAIRSGSLVGRYRLLHLVGRGGIGEVYAAHDPELDRKVAVKILRADANPDDVRAARLQREAQAVAKLSHPNVVAIYDVGTAGGRVFLTMELVEGETLAAWLDRKPRAPRDIIDLFVMAGVGLAAAHRAGIIHRDFKPQNVMVAPDGSARVMDFGLAAVAASNAPRLTVVGSILGTPLYMAPEQLLGRPVDPRADQFSFCVALYEALYGQRPFDGGNFTSLKEAVLAGRMRPPPIRAGVPAALRAALTRGLSVNREQRFSDMNELLDVIVRAAGGRGRIGVAALTLGVAVAVVFAGGFLWQRRGVGPRVPVGCTAPAKLASAWPALPDGPRRQLMRTAFLASGEPDASERFDRASEALDGYANAWSALSTRVCQAGEARSEPRQTALLRTACLEDRLVELSALTEVLAHADARVVRKARAAVLALPAIEACSDPALAKNAPEPPPDAALRQRIGALRNRLATLRVQAEAGNDWQMMQPVAALTDEVRAAGFEPLLVEALLTQARIKSPFDPDGAVPVFEDAYRRSIALRNTAAAAEAAIQLLTITGGFQHRFDVAEQWLRAAQSALEGSGPRSRLRGWFLDGRGVFQAARGRWQLADQDFIGALGIREQALGSLHPDLAVSLVHHARASLTLGHPERALEAADRALAIAGAIHPPGSYPVEAARLPRGQALVALGRAADGRRELEIVRTELERLLGSDHALLADPLTALGEAALLERRPGDARALLERAWDLRATHVADAGAREQTAFTLARAVWDSAPGDRAHALELANEAREGYAAVPDLSGRLETVERWLESHTIRRAKPWRPEPLGSDP